MRVSTLLVFTVAIATIFMDSTIALQQGDTNQVTQQKPDQGDTDQKPDQGDADQKPDQGDTTPAPTTGVDQKPDQKDTTPAPTTGVDQKPDQKDTTPAPTTGVDQKPDQKDTTPAPTYTQDQQQQQTPPPAKTCTEVSVEGDATYCIEGPICSGWSSTVPAGENCPKKGDVAVAACLTYLPSYMNDACVAPMDAKCAKIDTGVWGCVWEGKGTEQQMTKPSTTIPKTDCWDVSVQGDATYCIEGNICSGDASTYNHGTACPKKGDVAVESCLWYLESATKDGCVAPKDAECIMLDTGAYGCVWGGEKSVVVMDDPTPSPTSGKVDQKDDEKQDPTPSPTSGAVDQKDDAKQDQTPTPSDGNTDQKKDEMQDKNDETGQTSQTGQTDQAGQDSETQQQTKVTAKSGEDNVTSEPLLAPIAAAAAAVALAAIGFVYHKKRQARREEIPQVIEVLTP